MNNTIYMKPQLIGFYPCGNRFNSFFDCLVLLTDKQTQLVIADENVTSLTEVMMKRKQNASNVERLCTKSIPEHGRTDGPNIFSFIQGGVSPTSPLAERFCHLLFRRQCYY